jgi:transcriptional regulator with XRE-family HTH domain
VLSGDDSAVTSGDPIGTRIAKRRHVLGLSQAQLAQRVGVKRDAVSKWETGKHYPHRHLGKLEAVLGVTLTASEPEPWEQEIQAMTTISGEEKDAWVEHIRRTRAAEPAARQRAS